ncbi:MAG: bifunctional diguanylate cyclase/phosphodiesterase [Treponema sp.]|nr:bifunctional diguanylate cyclase/phosphodiesterase [Treponema sp.]
MRKIKLPGRHEFIEKTLDSITSKKRAHIIFYFLLLILFNIANYFLKATVTSQDVLMLGKIVVPIATLPGVFSSLANICLILLVVLFETLGFVTTFIILTYQTIKLIVIIFVFHQGSSLAGIFTDLFTLLAVIIMYLNNKQINRIQKILREQAVTDSLTGLPNRLACNELIKTLVKKGEKFALAMIDLNNFKTINDTLGHNAGNEVLKEIATRWKYGADSGLSGTHDFITRQGGDEFTLIIRDFKTDDDIYNAIKYYESVLEKRIKLKERDFFASASFGYAEYPADADNTDTLFSYADMAMYEIKRANSSAHILRFTPDLLADGEHSIEIERKIRTALEEDTIYFDLQPQFDMNHKLRGFEALARMKDSEGNIIPPGEFIPIAETVGLVDRIDDRIFRNSTKFFGELIKKSGIDAVLSVNVSVRHLIKDNFVDEVKSVLKKNGVPPKQLELEITESIMIDSEGPAITNIKALKEMGIRIAIDDFGTGYSSLSYLNRIPADLLKIDKSFIDKMNSSDSSKQYVASIISIGHIMNFDVISEGVEGDDQLSTLRDIGCDLIQGFIWGHPMSPEEAEKLVHQMMIV